MPSILMKVRQNSTVTEPHTLLTGTEEGGEVLTGPVGPKNSNHSESPRLRWRPTTEAIARYVQALGGQLQISAVSGDDLYILRGTDTRAA